MNREPQRAVREEAKGDGRDGLAAGRDHAPGRVAHHLAAQQDHLAAGASTSIADETEDHEVDASIESVGGWADSVLSGFDSPAGCVVKRALSIPWATR